MKFLNIKDYANIGLVCKPWNSNLNALWNSYDFLRDFNFKKFEDQ